MEELQAKYPSIEEETTGDIFDEDDQNMKILSKLNGPALRTLLVSLLGSHFTSEVS